MTHFKNILHRRQKQLTLDKFIVKKARKATAEEEESTASKRQRRENAKKENYSVFYGEGLRQKRYVST